MPATVAAPALTASRRTRKMDAALDNNQAWSAAGGTERDRDKVSDRLCYQFRCRNPMSMK
jgi:hypothetical protein